MLLGEPDYLTVREDVARRYLRGRGIEIGALNRPLRVPPAAHVRYADLMAVDELREMYAHFADQWLVDPEVIDDAQTLATLEDESEDFVIANHVFEHMENPLGALRSWLRVLRPGGVVYMAVPDRRRTFDAQRPDTAIEHLERDDAEGPSWSRAAHYEEYARLAERVGAAEVASRATELETARHDIHFHVFTLDSLTELLLHLRRRDDFPFEIELVQDNFEEVLVVLRRVRRDDKANLS